MYKFGQIYPTINVLLNSENLHTSQSEESNCKYDMTKGFSNLNPNLEKCLFSIKI